MCRFLLAKFEQSQSATELLEKFAEMCRQSKSLDGDDQGDGWGLAYVEGGQWQKTSSLEPIWEDQAEFANLPKTTMLVAHARSASFPDQKGVLAYNQPFVYRQHVFVFNGLLQGVKLDRPIPGKIGSQKIWYLVKELLKQGKSPRQALSLTVDLLKQSSKRVQALNLGLATFDDFWASCNYDDPTSSYYQLQIYQNTKQKLVCSEPLPGFEFQPMRSYTD